MAKFNSAHGIKEEESNGVCTYLRMEEDRLASEENKCTAITLPRKEAAVDQEKKNGKTLWNKRLTVE